MHCPFTIDSSVVASGLAVVGLAVGASVAGGLVAPPLLPLSLPESEPEPESSPHSTMYFSSYFLHGLVVQYLKTIFLNFGGVVECWNRVSKPNLRFPAFLFAFQLALVNVHFFLLVIHFPLAPSHQRNQKTLSCPQIKDK